MIKNVPKVFRNLKKTNLYATSTLNFKSVNDFSKKLGIGEATVALEEKISKISQLNDIKEYGTVISIGDGIARVFGLTKVQAGEMVEF
jgi:soluble P-type ATPase